MKIILKDFGAIKKAEMIVKDLTIISGKNNTGKTYAAYALYGFLKRWRSYVKPQINDELISRLRERGNLSIDLESFRRDLQIMIDNACEEYSKDLFEVFSSNKKMFENSEFSFEIDTQEHDFLEEFEHHVGSVDKEFLVISKDKTSSAMLVTWVDDMDDIEIPTSIIINIIRNALATVLFGNIFPPTFISSVERTGVAIFRQELDFRKNSLLAEIQSKKNSGSLDPLSLLDNIDITYPIPVQHNVDFVRNLSNETKRESFIFSNFPHILDIYHEIIGGELFVVKDEIKFKPNAKKSLRLSMDESSSTVRSMLDLGFYLRHRAVPGELLIIDEPELNLHPGNQRKYAKLIAALINIGIKVFITTHSDYIIREFNSLVMMHSVKEIAPEFLEKYEYDTRQFINPDQISAYVAKRGKMNGRGREIQTLIPMEVHNRFGIIADTFDEQIEELDQIQDYLFNQFEKLNEI